MNIISPEDFLSRWPNSLRPLRVTEPANVVLASSADYLAKFGLPPRLFIQCYNDITVEFDRAVSPLSEVWQQDLDRGLRLGAIHSDMCRYWHVGSYQYVQGGGWICIDENKNSLVSIDLDLPSPVSIVNSSLPNFYTTLAYFVDWSERNPGTPDDTRQLRDALVEQTCIPFFELKPFWINLIDATLDGDPINLAFRLGNERERGHDPYP